MIRTILAGWVADWSYRLPGASLGVADNDAGPNGLVSNRGYSVSVTR